MALLLTTKSYKVIRKIRSYYGIRFQDHLYNLFHRVLEPAFTLMRVFELAQKVMTLSDDSIGEPHSLMAFIHLLNRQYEKAVDEAIETLKKARYLNPEDSFATIDLAIAYSLAGREYEAKAMAEEYLTISPHFSVKRFEKIIPYKNQADTAMLSDTLRKAGFPE